MNLANRTFEGDVPKLTKWLYTSSGMFRDGAYQFVSMFLLVFVQFCALGGDTPYEDYVAMYGVITAIIIVLRIWDGFNDPIMGFIVEKCHFKSGKYRPWILVGAVLNSIVTVCMFWILPKGWAYVACFAVFYFLWDFTYTMNDIAFWSVLPSLSQKEQVRANLTTMLSIFISIGTFVVGALVPFLAAGNYETVYKYTALITSALFLISQVILVIFMKEKKVDENVEKNDEKMRFRDIFMVIVKNDQLRIAIIAILLFYTAGSVLVASGLNYFYFNFGYKDGGTYQLYFTIVYAAATLIGQFLYPVFVNKFKLKRMTLFSICAIVSMVGYLGLFFYVFCPNSNYVGFFPLLCVFAFFAFFGQTIMSLIIYIMIQDTIDYNEYKFNERRESSIFSLRAFTAKIGSSIQQLFLFIFLTAASLFSVSNQIANIEREYIGDSQAIMEEASKITGPEHIELWQRIVFQVGFTIVPMLLILAAFLLIRFGYKIDEKKHIEIVNAIALRKKNKDESTDIQK